MLHRTRLSLVLASDLAGRWDALARAHLPRRATHRRLRLQAPWNLSQTWTGDGRQAAVHTTPHVASTPTLAGSKQRTLAAIGTLGGSVGAVVGIGGGNIMVPFMTLVGTSLTQHQIIATSLVAVVCTGMASASSYMLAGAVHAPAAVLITVAASITAPLGARLSARLPAKQLRLCVALFVLACSPLVPLKGYLLQGRTDGTSSADTNSTNYQLSYQSAAIVFSTGALAGLSSGLLGIGGGVVLTPALALATDLPQVSVLGTSLTAMIIPSVVGALVHYRAGRIAIAAAWPLALGAAAGASVGGRCAMQLPEEELRLVFSGVMGCVGAYMLRAALKA